MANTLNVQGAEITIIKVHAEDGRKSTTPILIMANSPQLEIMQVLECGKQAYIESINNTRPLSETVLQITHEKG